MDYTDFLSEWLDTSRSYIEAHTSGSTGIPKCIRLDKDFVRDSARATNRFFHLGRGSRFHSCVSPDFIGGKMMAVRTLECDGRLTYETPSNITLSEVSPLETIDLLAVVPSQMLHILDNAENSPKSLPEIKNIIIGGSAIHPALRRRIAVSGLNAYETYGMTETSSHIALRHIDDIPDKGFSLIADASLSADSRGCLVIHYQSGYEVVTNDIVDFISPGEFKILGRADNVIVSGAKKINPEEVESRLSEIFEFKFAISSVPDSKWGEMSVIVVPEGESMPDNVIDKSREILPGWMTPKKVIRISALPTTPNGKIDRMAMKSFFTKNFDV